MKTYNQKTHIIYSTIASGILWIMLFFITKPSQWATVKGTMESVDSIDFVDTQMNYGYDLLFGSTVLLLIALLSLYKPIKKIISKM